MKIISKKGAKIPGTAFTVGQPVWAAVLKHKQGSGEVTAAEVQALKIREAYPDYCFRSGNLRIATELGACLPQRLYATPQKATAALLERLHKDRDQLSSIIERIETARGIFEAVFETEGA